MSNNEKQYFIYIRSTKLRVYCTKQQFDDYYRDINAYRRTQMNHGRCVCPPSKRLWCDMDCSTCPYRTSGDISSLDDNLTDEDGDEMTWLDRLQEELPELQTPSFDNTIAERDELKSILARLSELMPQALEIGELRLQGLSEDAIADKIGTGRKTYAYRLKKAFSIMKEEFPEYF